MVSIDPNHEQLEFHSNADRILQVLPLYQSGKVKKILLSGGSGRLLGKEKEAEQLKKYLVKIGINPNDIWVENRSRNTYENALFTMELLKQKKVEGKILLCTSSSHMKRSFLCFKKQGVDVQIYPVDPFSLSRELNPETLLIPKAYILQNWYHLIHEWIGLLIYKTMGYC